MKNAREMIWKRHKMTKIDIQTVDDIKKRKKKEKEKKGENIT